MGFDGMYLGRIHYEEKEWREEHREMEMLWQTDPTQGKEGQIFVGVLPNVYWPPKGFCFDMYCNDEEVTVRLSNDVSIHVLEMYLSNI